MPYGFEAKGEVYDLTDLYDTIEDTLTRDTQADYWLDILGEIFADALATLEKGFAYTLPNGVKLRPVGD